jgi:hypothetical protein
MRSLRRTSPTIEPAPRRGRIDATGSIQGAMKLCEMPASVHQDVRDRVPHLPRRTQHMEMEAIGEDGAAPSEDPIDGPSQSSADRLHAVGEIERSRRLDDHVHVIDLYRIVNDAESATIARCAQRAFERPNETDCSQRRNVLPNLDRHMAGMSTGKQRAPAMRIARVGTGLSPCTLSNTAP